jgi:glycosyltransferase involved in cell wall biosynthesis
MRVQFSQHIFSSQEVGGISNYFINLAESLPARDVSIEMNFPLAITRSLENTASYGGTVVPKRVIKRGITWRLVHAANASSELGTRFLTRRMVKPDVFHRTYYSTTGNYASIPEVITVYDMIHEDFPEYFQKPILKKKLDSLRLAAQIICISEYTRSRLLDLTDIDSSKIAVIPHGIEHENLSSVTERPTGGRPYIAYVGTRSGYKNFEVLALAFSELIQIYRDLNLMLVGGGPISVAESDLFDSLQITPNILKIDHAVDTSDLISKAQCVVSTSFAEGFGLVPLESLAQGIPCVVSDIDVNREIWGDSLPTFPANDHIKLAKCIQQLLESDDYWTSVSKEGFAIAQSLSAKRMAESTLDVYKRAAANKTN